MTADHQFLWRSSFWADDRQYIWGLEGWRMIPTSGWEDSQAACEQCEIDGHLIIRCHDTFISVCLAGYWATVGGV